MENSKVIFVDSYYKVRELAHGVKGGDVDAIQHAAKLMSKKVNGGIFIPIPSHTGKATYTLELARMIADMNDGLVFDILSSEPRELLYNQKIDGKNPHEIDLGFVAKLEGGIKDCNVYLVDNVIDSGNTYNNAKNAIKNVFHVEPMILVLGVVDNESIEKLGYNRNYQRMFG